MPVLLCLENPHAAGAFADYLDANRVAAERVDDVGLARRLLRFRRYDGLVCESVSADLAAVAKKRDAGTRTVVLATQPEERGANVDAVLIKPLPLAIILASLGESSGATELQSYRGVPR